MQTTNDGFILELNNKLRTDFTSTDGIIFTHTEEDIKLSIDFTFYPPKLIFESSLSCDSEMQHIARRIKCFTHTLQNFDTSFLRATY